MYNLQDFQLWIQANKSQILQQEILQGTFNRQDIPSFWNYFHHNPDRWEKIIQGQELGTLRQKVVQEWMREVEARERERERDN